MTVGIQTPTGASRPGDLSFTGIPDNSGHVGHIYVRVIGEDLVLFLEKRIETSTP